MGALSWFFLCALFDPVSAANGHRSLLELYDRQVYLSHLQARALYGALGRSLGPITQVGRESATNDS